MMMEDDMIIYKDKIYNWERWCVKWVRRFKVPAKVNQQTGTIILYDMQASFAPGSFHDNNRVPGTLSWHTIAVHVHIIAT